MSRRGSDASSRPGSARSKSAVLNPFSSSSTSSHTIHGHGHGNESLSLQSHRRTRDPPSLPLDDLLRPYITIKPQFSLHSTAANPSILKPLMVLPRERLSLSNLDLSAPTGEFTPGPGRFFESHIRILDLAVRQGPSILIARSDATRHVYAIERHQTGLYVVCKLGAWVNIERLSNVAVACYAPRCRPAQAAGASGTEAPSTTPQIHKENKRKQLAIEEIQSMVRKRPRTMSVALSDTQGTQSQPPAQLLEMDQGLHETTAEQPTQDPKLSLPVPSGSQPTPLDSNHEAHVSAEDIFQNLRLQYFEALYHSKGSLAYFAKGPMSRARAAFHLDCDANLEMNDLVDFLKSLVMAIAQVDKKYKGTVPNLINDMKMLAETSEEEGTIPKRRKFKKMKFGKDGLYPGEVDHVKKWWRANKLEIRDDGGSSTNSQEAKYHISCLRTRETQLQMIILLEILALEAVQPVHDAQESQLPGMPIDSPPKEGTIEITSKKQNKHNFAQLLNLHADRMCIWQDTTLEEMSMIAAESEAKNGQGLQKSNRANTDPLKDFCMDIVVPFFTGRLPELSMELNKKLGGPVAASPPKPKKTMAPSGKPLAKPGSIVKRPVPTSRASQSLEKVFESDQQRWKASRRPVDVLARMRSATPATIPGLKREASEPLGLGGIPHGMKSLKERPRNVLSRSVSSTGTEDTKSQKQAKMEAELKEAISAIKKPNRHMVGKAIVEEAEKRTGTSSSPHPRKQKKPVRYVAAASRVQVKATPANFRFRDAISADSQSYDSLNLPLPRVELGSIPSSSSAVPATAPRNSFRNELRDDLAAFHIASTPDKVLGTPVPALAGMAQTWEATAKCEFVPPSSPIMSRKPANYQCHLTVPGGDDIEPSSPVLHRLFETPIKQKLPPLPTTLMEQAITSTPPEPINKTVLFATPAKKGPTSIPPTGGGMTQNNTKPTLSLNQQLGWDDYDFDDF